MRRYSLDATLCPVTDEFTGPTEVRETHVSILFFVGDRVFKLKKPVRLDFLDFSTRERRELVCRRELELNRRLAPDVYLDVLDIVGSDGQPRDHLLLMRRMPDDRRLSMLTARGGADDCIREVARAVAAFHARCETSREIAAHGDVERVRSNWESNFATMEPFIGTVLDPDVALEVQSLARRYLDGRAALFDRRIAHGKVRDGHGDLLADDIFCLDDGPRILDCIEFDDDLRYGDVLADVAFLAMDLERVADLRVATRFLDWYREFAAETYPQTLAEHYLGYRAHVRSKVACLRSAQGDDAGIDAARQLLGMTHEHLRGARVTLVLVGGLPGTGKSTVASGLADTLGWTLLRSDELRKDLAGIGHTEHAGADYREGIYAPEATDATYRELLVRARSLLALGEPTILDASWADAGWRERAVAVSRGTSSEMIELRCELDAAVAAQRLSERSHAGGDASDATAATAAQMAPDFAPWPSAVALDTTGDAPSTRAAALDLVRR
jgi:aminoglycoside phosphotransferase family enzyme/predicted kinase